jgi:hypothetical protein
MEKLFSKKAAPVPIKPQKPQNKPESEAKTHTNAKDNASSKRAAENVSNEPGLGKRAPQSGPSLAAVKKPSGSQPSGLAQVHKDLESKHASNH